MSNHGPGRKPNMSRFVVSMVLTLLVGGLLAGSAGAQTVYPPETPEASVNPEVVTTGGVEEAQEVAEVQVQGETQEEGLAFTGAEVGLLVLTAGGLAAIGAMALIAARRRRAQAA
jgi:hypothetical protein